MSKKQSNSLPLTKTMETRNMKKLTQTTLLVVCLTCLLAAGCSRMTEFEGVQCIRTVHIAATNMECNWEKYNAEQKEKNQGG